MTRSNFDLLAMRRAHVWPTGVNDMFARTGAGDPAVRASLVGALSRNEHAEVPHRGTSPGEVIARLAAGNRRFMAGTGSAAGRGTISVSRWVRPAAAIVVCGDLPLSAEQIFDQARTVVAVYALAATDGITPEIVASIEAGCLDRGCQVVYFLTQSSPVQAGKQRTCIADRAAAHENLRTQAGRLARMSHYIRGRMADGRLLVVAGEYDPVSRAVARVEL